MIDEKNAVEVVDFVQNSAGEKTVNFDADFLAIFGLGFDAGFLRAWNFAVDGRDG